MAVLRGLFKWFETSVSVNREVLLCKFQVTLTHKWQTTHSDDTAQQPSSCLYITLANVTSRIVPWCYYLLQLHLRFAGGFQRVRSGLETIASQLGVEVRCSCPVTAIHTSADGLVADGVLLAGGELLSADVVVANRDVPLAFELLDTAYGRWAGLAEH